MSLCVSPSGVAFPIHRTFWVSKFAVVSLTVNVRLSDVVDFEFLAAPTREPTRKLVKGLRTGKAKTYAILKTAVQTMKTAENTMFTVYLFTIM